MSINVKIKRCKAGGASYWQSFIYDPADSAETVATMLTRMNAAEDLRDAEKNKVSEIIWECSCLQKRCGACAMVINGVPSLACDRRLSECGREIVLEPLRKFPVVADLKVDRSIMRENLKELHAWLEKEAVLNGKNRMTAYEASKCLQCGICLEICPNFAVGGSFTGMAAAVPAARLLTELQREASGELGRAYRKRVYEGCGKSLACKKRCPAGIDTEKMLAGSNAAAVWQRKIFRKKDGHVRLEEE